MTIAALKRRLETMELEGSRADFSLARLYLRQQEAGQLPTPDGYHPPEGFASMTDGELTLDRLRWKHRDI